MRSIADQTESELGGPWSVLVRQQRDHVELDRLLHRLETSDAPEDEQEILHRIARLVFPHAFAEESVLWPVMRRVLPDGHALTLQVEQEHQEVNELWVRLEDPAATPDQRRAAVDRLVEVLREDVRDEEDELFPRLQERVDVARLRRLGVAWELVRRTAPTRPHPVVARRPPGNALAALPLTVLDRSRDGLDAVARRAPTNVAPRLAATSQALARAAGRVEQVGVMKRGEDPSTHRD
jgi:hemerythrin superfamily protein